MKRPIVLIGGGRMGAALLKGWVRHGIGPLIVVEPKPAASLHTLKRAGTLKMLPDAGQISEHARACIVALKPQVLISEAERLRPLADAGALMISIAAGIGISTLIHAWGKGARIVRAMPNTPGAVGRGISGLYARPNVGSADRKLAEGLLSALGETLWVGRETLVDSVTAVSGSGPAYVFLLAEALAEAARAEGLPPDQAERLARATVTGAGALLDVKGRSAAELRRDVTSPGGTTEAALKVLLAPDGLRPLLGRAVHAARQRAGELSG